MNVSVSASIEEHLEARIAATASFTEQHFQELATTFTEALQMEREARMHETSQLRAALEDSGASHSPAGSSVANVAQKLAEAAGVECDRFVKVVGDEWVEFSERASVLQSHLSTELSEQHFSATRTLADQQATALRALAAQDDERASEVSDLLRHLRLEVTTIANEAAAEVMEQQDRDRQCAELRIALHEVTHNGTMLGSQSSAKGDLRRFDKHPDVAISAGSGNKVMASQAVGYPATAPAESERSQNMRQAGPPAVLNYRLRIPSMYPECAFEQCECVPRVMWGNMGKYGKRLGGSSKGFL